MSTVIDKFMEQLYTNPQETFNLEDMLESFVQFKDDYEKEQALDEIIAFVAKETKEAMEEINQRPMDKLDQQILVDKFAEAFDELFIEHQQDEVEVIPGLTAEDFAKIFKAPHREEFKAKLKQSTYGPQTEANIKLFDTLSKIVKQLEDCDYQCKGGPLKNNVAFISLQRMAQQQESAAEELDEVIQRVGKNLFGPSFNIKD
jgi:hypothetical protein